MKEICFSLQEVIDWRRGSPSNRKHTAKARLEWFITPLTMMMVNGVFK